MPGKIGINVPWVRWDEDFGKTRPPPWFSQIDAELANLKSIGVEVIRWFVLMDGGSYSPMPTPVYAPLDNEPDRYKAGDATLDVTGRIVTPLLGGAAAVLVWPSARPDNQGFPFSSLTDFEKNQIKQASRIIHGQA
jgi:hypothetical protein